VSSIAAARSEQAEVQGDHSGDGRCEGRQGPTVVGSHDPPGLTGDPVTHYDSSIS
jgi:hypothetical protein